MLITNPFSSVFDILSAYNEIKPITELPIKVDVLREVVKARCELKTIHYREADATTQHVLGNVKFYYPVVDRTFEPPSTAVIKYRKELGEDLSRVVVCKELCHCLIDTENDHVTSPEGLKMLLEGLAADLPASVVGDGPITSEHWALYMAIEILCPMEVRAGHILALNRQKSVTIEKIAERYAIPVEFAEIAFRNNSYFQAARAGRNKQFISLKAAE